MNLERSRHYKAIFEIADGDSSIRRWIYRGPDCRVGTYHLTTGTSLFEVAEHSEKLCLLIGQTFTPILHKPQERTVVAS